MLITPETLLQMLEKCPKDRTSIVDLPDGLEAVGTEWNSQTHSFYVTVKHESFPEVPASNAIPLIEIDLTEWKIPRRKPTILL